jgi:hypothetical protein
MHPNLSFEQAPPISVPFRFLLTAPWFGILAGLLLVWQGEAVLASRWSPGALALTHLFTVGFMLQAMCGALLQFVPVATGGNVWRPHFVAWLVHPALGLGALMLVFALAANRPDGFRIATPVLATGLSVFIATVAWAMWRTSARGMTLPTLRMALIALAVTLALGVYLSSALGWQLDLGWPLHTLVNVHAAWGLAGWALLLVMGVSYLVVPMFQLTPQYPLQVSRLLPVGLFVVVLLWSGLWVIDGVIDDERWASGSRVLVFAGLALAAAYGGVTLWLQKQRRRRVTDPTFLFWRAGMLALWGLLVSWLVMQIHPAWGEHPRAVPWMGVLTIMGVFCSVINGMLYKIVPFLIWLHLQNLGNLKTLPPNIKQMISERAMRGQMWAHGCAVMLLLAAVIWPAITALAGVAMMASFVWLEWNLVGAVRLYLEFKRRHPLQAAS